MNRIDLDKWLKFIERIQNGYNPVSYHNKTHAADVAQTLYYFLVGGEWMKKGEMDNLDLFSMILASAIHDYEHPGYNNMFLINSSHPLAIRYNDVSVLEMHHVAASSKLMKDKSLNFMSTLDKEVQKDLRK